MDIFRHWFNDNDDPCSLKFLELLPNGWKVGIRLEVDKIFGYDGTLTDLRGMVVEGFTV